jgi:hypothetical protein
MISTSQSKAERAAQIAALIVVAGVCFYRLGALPLFETDEDCGSPR